MGLQRVKKRAFSLIEVLIACLLIAICGTACVIHFERAATERRVKNTLEFIDQKLLQAALIARVRGGNVKVIIDGHEPPKIYLSTDLLVGHGAEQLLKEKVPLEGVTHVKLVGVSAQESNICFYQAGVECPTAHLEVLVAGQLATIPLEKYAVSSSLSQPSDIAQIFPDEVIKNEKEKTVVLSH